MITSGFFRICDNSFDKRGYPWGQDILRGYNVVGRCFECSEEGTRISVVRGEVEIGLAPRKGSQWPDMIGCGHYPLFIISRRMMDDWRNDGVGEFPSAPVLIAEPLPKKLAGTRPPEYVWLDGKQMQGALLDFDVSGYVDVQFCPSCGTRTDDISATHRRRDDTRNGIWHDTFVEGSWNGANIFTTDLSPCVFCCTWKVVECARRHKHTNVRFVPIEAGSATWSKGLDYLGKTWPPYHPLRCSEGKSLEEWLQALCQPKTRFDASCALLDLGEDAAPAVPELMSMLKDEREWIRREARLVLRNLKRLGIPVDVTDDELA